MNRKAARSALLIILALLPLAPRARALGFPNAEAWFLDGEVNAVACAPSAIYVGGAFTYAGPSTGGGVPLDAATGRPRPVFPKVNGIVNACVPDGAGGWFIGGVFSQVDAIPCKNLAHILASGGVDAAWNPNPTGASASAINALAVSGGVVYVGGSFDAIGGQARSNLAALSATTGNATAWRPVVAAPISKLALSGSTLYVSGPFTSIGGQSRNTLAALDTATGAVKAWNPNPSRSSGAPSVYALMAGNGVIYAGGYFNTIGGQSRNNLAALDAATGQATAWNPNSDGAVSLLAPSGGVVYASGGFTTIGGKPRSNLAALDATTGKATSWIPPALNNSATALTASGATVYVGGLFTSIGGQTRYHIAALDAATGALTAWNPVANYMVSCLAVSGSTVYAGGRFFSVGGQVRNNLAAFDPATGAVTAWNPNVGGGANAPVYALAVSGSTVYAGGYFTSIGGQTRNYLAALNATTGAPTAWNPNPVGLSRYTYVNALAVSGSKVYVGGSFYAISGQPRNNLAALDISTGNATSWNPDINGVVNTLAVLGSTVYAGGSFSAAGGQPRNNLAALNASTGAPLSWKPSIGGGSYGDAVYALALSGSMVYVAGDFTTVGSQTRNHIAAIHAATGATLAWNPNVNGVINALMVIHGVVLAGGEFTTVGGKARLNFTAIDGSTGAPLAWRSDASYPESSTSSGVYALAVSGASTYIGGELSVIGPYTQCNLARLPTPSLSTAARAWRGYP